MAKKSFLQNIWNILTRNKTDSIHNNISVTEALALQKEYMHNMQKHSEIADYPPYIDIARQLFSPKSEIFRGAVFYLTCIAENQSKDADSILDILKKYAQTTRRNDDDNAYLLNHIKKIEKSLDILN